MAVEGQRQSSDADRRFRIITKMSACTAAAWRRHFQTAAFLLERGIVPAVLERLSDLDRPDDLARAAGVSRKR